MIWWLACASEAPRAGGLPAPVHANGWDALVAASERGDLPTAKVLARDLTLGPVADDHPAAGKLGAALGMAQTAEDVEELADAVSAARQACESCHAAAQVP